MDVMARLSRVEQVALFSVGEDVGYPQRQVEDGEMFIRAIKETFINLGEHQCNLVFV
jgi:hypothetical protein